MTQAAQRTLGNTSLSHCSSVAADLEAAVAPMFGGRMPVRIRAWDGTGTGPDDAPTVEIRYPDALRRLVYAPGEVGLAQAYVTGELDVDGDLLDGFRRVWRSIREQGASPRLSPRVLAAGLRTAARVGALGRPPAPPRSQARLRGRLNSLGRDRDAIAHHYDLSNDFYAPTTSAAPVGSSRCHRGRMPPREDP